MKLLLVAAALLAAGLSIARAAELPPRPENAAANAPPLTVLTPPAGEPAYQIAGEIFAELWEKVTGRRPAIVRLAPGQLDLPPGDVVIIGSDSVNPVVHELIRGGALENLGIMYGGDAYCIRTLPHGARRHLILAGGSGRATIYAVYDFFRRQAGAEYFWDGDVIPRRDQIDWDGLDVRQSPRFDYRGLRYFAHRGLHRFQAEHWDLDDWKHEIDWLLKKRFNLFMLRTGIDDLFQRAFPDDAAYPPTDGIDPDAKPRSYDDRTAFWPLRYRGELRKAVLQYARDRGLLHPEDTGTITHWYSHTPSSFYRSRPDFPVIRDQKTGYALATHAIWDIESQVTWDAYWQLTQTHIRDFGEPRIFHTIGMAERTFGSSDRDNLQRKLYVYRKTQQTLREHYPDAPLLIASWDFVGWWKDADVQQLLQEFDPRRTIILDYTADCADKVTYRDWKMLGQFPWIFGIFHGFARNSDIHEDYTLVEERLREAAQDDQCRGLVVWSEISHSDTFLLEYLADNSWQPARPGAAEATARYCQSRYPAELAGPMLSLWTAFLPIAQAVHWSTWSTGSSRTAWSEPQFRMLTGGAMANLTPERLAALEAESLRMRPALEPTPEVLRSLAGLAENAYDNPLWRRDTLDMARTVASRALFVAVARGASQMEAWRQQQADPDQIRRLAQVSQDLLAALGGVLAMSDDFSMDATFRRLARARELGGVQPILNPHTEQTLKGNAENDYCRSHHYELVEHVYRPEMAAYWQWVLARLTTGDRSPWRRPAEFTAQAKAIAESFYQTPLAELAPTGKRDAATLAKCLLDLESSVKRLLDELQD
jgi:hypothetical protein